MNRLLKKLVAVLLVITLASANLLILGMYSISYALTDKELAGQTTQTGNSNVEFNAYFEGGSHIRKENMDSKTAKMYVNLKVKNAGYLKNGIIIFENVNFKMGDIKNEYIQSIDKENNKIVLKQLNNGSDVTLEIPISILSSDRVSKDYFSKEIKVKFSGIYTDGNGKQKNVSKETVNKLSWKGNAQPVLTSELTKFIPYTMNEKYGIMLQAKVNAGIANSIVPVKKLQIHVQVPEINGVKPTSVSSIAIQTKSTNGDEDGLKFTEQNYTYDAEKGILDITVENVSDEIMWIKNVQDEYLVTFIFENEEVYHQVKENGVNTTARVSATVEVYNCDETVLNVPAIDIEMKAEEKLGMITDFEMETIAQMSKGQIYANYDVTKKKEVSYFQRYIATVSSSDLTDSITFIQGLDKFLTKDKGEGPTTVSGNHYAYNKEVSIGVDVFHKMLGEEGSIDVYRADKTKIGTINKQTEIREGRYVLDISNENTNQILVVTSKPQLEGRIDVTVQKAIKTKIDYAKNQIREFEKLETSVQGKTNTDVVNAKKEILLRETASVARVAISKKDLTTVVKNENVEIRATLDTSSEYRALYKNPTLKIELPSYISKVEIKNYNIVMGNGLKIKGTPQVTTENGSQVITIILEGMQQEYTMNAEYEGTIVVLNTDITVKTLTPSNQNKIKMVYTNENEMSTNRNGEVETELNFVAPTGVVAANGISNYATKSSNIMSISEKGVTGELEAYGEKKIATIYGKVVNNYENAIGNIVILGRIPKKDNQKIDSQENMGSTFDAILRSGVTVKGMDKNQYTVYYSESTNATADLSQNSNGWTTTATTGAKSYMIVTKGYELAKGNMIEFSYNVEVPANIANNNSTYEMYKVYYNNLSSIGRMAEMKESSIVGLATEAGPELQTKLTAVIPTDYVREGQIIKMKATVKNIGQVVANEVRVIINAPEYTQFAEYHISSGINILEETVKTKTLIVGTVKPGETKEVVYYLKVKDETAIELPDIPEDDGQTVISNELKAEIEAINQKNRFPKAIVNTANVAVQGLENTIPSDECRLVLNQGSVEIKLVGSAAETEIQSAQDTMFFRIFASRIGSSTKNAVLELQLPNGMIYESAIIKDFFASKEQETERITYDKNTNLLRVDLKDLPTEQVVEIQTNTGNMNDKFQVFAKVKTDEMEDSYSNVLEYEVKKAEVSISELTSTPKYVKEDKEISYKIAVSNKTDMILQNVIVQDSLPEGVTLVEASFEYAGRTEKVTNLSEDGSLKVNIARLEVGETKEVIIKVRANLLPNKTDKQIQNKVTVSVFGGNSVTSNIVSNTIEYDAGAHITEGDNPNPVVNRYKITGTAWIDSNRNGKRESDEKILSDVPVILLNKSSNKIVRDVDSQEEKRTVTGADGKYTFDNLEPNEYLVVFLYDIGRYSITEYQAKGVDAESNSDAIDINLTLDGKRTVAGITDVIRITNENIRSIDIGLYTAEKFDLRLDKTISKITLTTPTAGTKTYNYDNKKLTKVEVLGKSIGKSNLVIEYKIKVTNEGAVAGYARKIVDYLPKGVGFSTELNKDWYLSDNGNVYNASLANTLIKPGESKEVTIVLTKKITEETLKEIIRNNAEIYESYNEQGLKDVDSTAGNKIEDEDDYSGAETIVSIVTGKIVTYTAIGLVIVAVLGIGIYGIKRKVIQKGKKS